jgi:dipeptidyl aminopeptidase/acylaminoacyl peptidase
MKVCQWIVVWIACTPLLTIAAPPLKAYGELPGLTDAAISLDGTRVASVVTIEGKRTLLAQTVNGSALLHFDVGQMKVRSLAWAGNDIVIAVVTSTQNLGMDYGFNHELSNIAILDVTTGKGRWILEEQRQRYADAIFGFFGLSQEDDRWYAYVGTMPLEHSRDRNSTWIANFNIQLTRVDVLSGQAETVARGTSGVDEWLVDHQGSVIAHATYDDLKKKWRLYAGSSRSNQLVEYGDIYGDNAIQGQGRTVGTVLISQQDTEGRAHYIEVTLAGDRPPEEIFVEHTADRFIFDRKTGLLSGIVIRGQNSTLRMLDARMQARVVGTRKAFPNLHVDFHSWNSEFDRLVVFTEGLTDAGTWWIVDIKAGSAKELGWNYPTIRSADIGPYELVHYKAADGLEMEGVLTLPPGSTRKNLPVIVMPHGGPESRDTLHFDWWAQAFASRGYAVWQPNFRGSSGYGIEFRDAGLGQWGRKMQTDISDGLAELVKQGLVDAKRACIVGASYGGYAALAGVTVQRGLYKCAVSVGGISDLKSMLAEERRTQRTNVTRYWRDFMGATGTFHSELDTISPARLAKQADAPVLLIHGQDDTVVLPSQSRTMYRARRRENKTVVLKELAGEDHWLSRGSTRSMMLDEAVKFVEQYNPSAP